jgi:hypothetical protein
VNRRRWRHDRGVGKARALALSKSRVQQHQIVYDALKAEMGELK